IRMVRIGQHAPRWPYPPSDWHARETLVVKITGIETLRLENEDFCYLRVHTDEGISGLGETCFGPQAVEAYVHESVASRLIGQDPLDISRHARDLPRFYIGHGGTGVSTRAHSA